MRQSIDSGVCIKVIQIDVLSKVEMERYNWIRGVAAKNCAVASQSVLSGPRVSTVVAYSHLW